MAQIVEAKFFGGPVTLTGVVTASVVEINLVQIPLSLSPPDNVALHAEFVLVLKDGSNNVATTRWSRAFKRIAGATSALGTISQIVAVQGDSALATAVAVLDNSGDTIRGRITGIAATTITASGVLILNSSPWTG